MASVLVTGANRGIGLELCRQLVARGDKVIAACRKASPELRALDLRVEEGVDVGQPAQIEKLAQRLRGESIDLLINNAGVLHNEALGHIDASAIDHIQAQFAINSLGPLLMTQALLPNLHDGSKVAIITSRVGSIADNTSGGMYGYRMSKAAVNIAGMSLARDLAPKGIAVALLHPGFVRTEMTSGQGLIDPPESAQGLIRLIDQLTLETSGGFWHTNGEVLPW